MLYVDDTHFDASYFERCFSVFDRHPTLGSCRNERVAVRAPDPAFLVALTLYMKENGRSLFPLPGDSPLEAARRRAAASGCKHLLFGNDAESALNSCHGIEPSEAPPSAQQPALIQTSSGTTGAPKMICRSWASIDAELASYTSVFDPDGRLLPVVAAPVHHSYGLLSGVLAAFARGLEPSIVQNPNPKLILRKLSEVGSSILYSSPTLINALCLLVRENEPLHSVMTSGTLMQKAWFEAVRKKVRHLHQQYGCSEGGCLTLGKDIQEPHDLGQALPHVELIAGASAAEPREVVAKLRPGTQISTGDLGFFEGDRLHFVSRLDDLINVSGLNVYPAEVEGVVLEMPGVTDAVVFKRTHKLGHDCVALQFVADERLPDWKVREWCAQRLTSYQVPMEVKQVESIPKAANGKLSRKALAEA